MKNWKPILWVLLAAVIFCGCGKTPAAETKPEAQIETPPQTAAAPEETETDKALLAYQQLLLAAPGLQGEHEELADASFGYEQNQERFGRHYDQFALVDLDRNGVPELIALTQVNFRWTPISVFTYAGGEAVLLTTPEEAHGTFEQNSSANGAYITFLCEEGHIHSLWRGNTPAGDMEEDSAYVLTGTTLTAVDCAVGQTGKTVYFSDIAVSNTPENAETLTGN